ncbi:GtrA family protein [Halobaculum sp. MBLA0143]|uniref:GtrA family protein n=1 Tax=Halobaculum sp. MBLA0143 TaxID=3079933 RepID=UPI0035258E44
MSDDRTTAPDGGESSTGTVDALLSGTRIGQFLSVGVAGATLETVVLSLLDPVLGLPFLVAKAVGAEASITLMFLLNDNWTFDGESDASVVRRWLRSNSVRIVGVGIAAGIGQALVTFVDPGVVVAGFDVWAPVANLAGIGVAMVVNYVAESLFTWRIGV